MRRPNALRKSIPTAAADGGNPSPSEPLPKLRSRFCLLSAVLVASAAGGVALVAVAAWNAFGPLRFDVIIDAGSSGTRIHVIAFRPGAGAIPALDRRRISSMRATPGLSAFAASPSEAGESLVELLDFARRRVPRSRWFETEIRLMATAGLRRLDAQIAEEILVSCRAILRRSRFRFQDDWVSVISGADEGIYAWVTANYALGALGRDPHSTSGIIELGGASAQVTFFTTEPLPPEFSHKVQFGGQAYSLYSHSFLHLGQIIAYESLQKLLSSNYFNSAQQVIYRDPCSQRGFSLSTEALMIDSVNSTVEHHSVHAAGNFTECKAAALMLLHQKEEKCSSSKCLIGAAFIPKLQGRFIALENFYHTAKFFGLDSKALLSDLALAGEQFCQYDWSELKRNYPLDEDELVLYCFSSAYIVALLHDSLEIAMHEKRITFANEVNGLPLDWALGAFIMQKASDRSSEKLDWIQAAITSGLPGLFAFLVVPCLVLILLKLKRQKQSLYLSWRETCKLTQAN